MPEKPKIICEGCKSEFRTIQQMRKHETGCVFYQQGKRDGAKAEREKILHKMSMISANCPEGELKQYWGLKAELEK